MTGWSYWATNLPYFPSLLYFAAGEPALPRRAVMAGVVVEQHLLHGRSLIGLTFAVSLNIVGLEIGKWLSNAGAIAAWISAGLLIAARRRVVVPFWFGHHH